MPVPPPNAYQPNTKLVVGSHNVSIIKYISEGGFAHVYTCTIDPPFRGNSTACLKRVAVPSKLQLNLLRQEVDAMKRLKGNKCIVSYIDSHASRMELPLLLSSAGSQQYEVFLLMEYCSRNGLIDFMNSRLTHKLQEPEILQVMRDITTGVAMCHNLQPPLIHRDIKIENVLIDHDGTYKLCDFGSAINYQPSPKTPQDTALLKNDIMQYTTPQYRAPEMIELSRGFPIDDKLDIWALGCLLYKLCYYTTPFELPQHQSLTDMERAILSADHSLKLPHDQPGLIFLPRLKNMIKCCLREDPRRRPNASQLLVEICSMMNVPVPDIIPSTVKHHKKLDHKLPPPPTLTPSTSVHSISVHPVSTTEDKFPPRPVKTDPFLSIDKSKFLLVHSPTTAANVSNKPSTSNPRPKSTYLPRISPPDSQRPSLENYNRFSTSSTSLKDFVQKQVDESANEVLTSFRKSEDNGTLDFLRSKQESQHTGGSFKMNFLRKISTGGIATNGTGGSISSVTSNSHSKSHYRKSSVTSIKQILTGGGSSRKASNTDDDHKQLDYQDNNAPAPERKLSIKKRMAMLLNNSNSAGTKTASGYGKYTDTGSNKKTNVNDDLDAINKPVTPYSSASSSDDENKIKLPKRSPIKPKPKPKPPTMPASLNIPLNNTSALPSKNAHNVPKVVHKVVPKVLSKETPLVKKPPQNQKSQYT